MPPKGSTRADAASASESEAKQSSNLRAHTKARNAAAQAAQAAQAALLARHINSNGPQDKAVQDPMDFESLPDESLRKYRDQYNLPVKSSLSQEGFLLTSEIGKKSLSYKSRDRVTKAELAENVKKHFLSQPVRESEIITNFLYKVNNQDKAFKLDFKN